jgi:hypothetical protein
VPCRARSVTRPDRQYWPEYQVSKFAVGLCLKLESTSSDGSRRFQIFVRVWAGFGLLIFASTWKLWTPQTEFPQIPFFEFLVDVPGWADWMALALLGLSLTACLFSSSRSLVAGSLWLFAIAASGLILLNQHRLQPWAYQFVVFAIILATARPKTAFFWMRWIVISIYIYSAISKLDYQFVHTVGDQMLSSWSGKLGLDTTLWSEQFRNWIVFAFPLTELLIGVGLMIPRVRGFAFVAAVLMHLTLLAALIGNVDGPGVLIWNVFFIVQAVFLFGQSLNPKTTRELAKNETDESESGQIPTNRQRSSFPLAFVATTVSLFVLVFPMTQPFGICDHWPAWQVYAPRTSRAQIKKVIKNSSQWNHMDFWSNSTLKVPVYPQARFQLAVAMAAQIRFQHANGRAIEVSGESDRWTGSRETKSLRGDQIKMHAEGYWLNLKPRSLWINETSDR